MLVSKKRGERIESFFTALAVFIASLPFQILIKKQLFCASLNGTVSFVYKNVHHVFSNNEIAQGFVRMGGGFTIKAGAKATLDTVVSVSSAIDLRETGILQLVKNLNLDTGLTWSSGGYINGRGKAILLNGPLSIPASKIIRIIGDTVIDGQNNTVFLDSNAQIIVDSNATLTLRNLTLRNSRNGSLNPCIQASASTGKLALDNANIAMSNDLVFAQGNLYIHNDVIFSGTSSFIYTSQNPCFVAPESTLYFDIGTTFSYQPASLSQDLFILQSRTSSLYLNGCTFKITGTGIRMTRGNLILDNKVSLIASGYQSSLVPTTTDYGVHFATELYSLDWHPSGTILALGGKRPTNGAGGFNNSDHIRLYGFNGSTLTTLTSASYGSATASEIYQTQFNPNGTILAVAGYNPLSPSGGFANTNELRLYQFGGSILTPLTSVNFGIQVDSLDWHPSGTIIAIGGWTPNSIRIYGLSGSTLSLITSFSFPGTSSSADTLSLSWNPNGTILAVGGYPADTISGEVFLYRFTGTGVTRILSLDYSNNGGDVRSLDWHPSGTILAVGGIQAVSGLGGFSNRNLLRIYGFNGTALSPITSTDYGLTLSPQIHSLSWNRSGTKIAITGHSPDGSKGLEVFRFGGSTLTAHSSSFYQPGVGLLPYAAKFSPVENSVLVGGVVGSSGAGNQEVWLMSANGGYGTTNASRGQFLFGKSSLGSSYDLNVEVLGRAHVDVDGYIVDDSA